MLLIDYATFIAFGAYTTELVIQMFHLVKRKSSKDISLRACFVRMFAGMTVLAKYIFIQEWVLIAGQGSFNAIYILYAVLVLKYRGVRLRVPWAKKVPAAS
ncbi:MAG: hypothetical protein ACLFO2_05565 [Candidatus Woesearchaeota archaeon]